MAETAIKVGPADHGRRMSLKEFDKAEVQEGYLYELGRGVVTVSDVPDTRHFAQVDELRQQLSDYRRAHPGKIHRLAAGSDCKLLIPELESERHPDIAVYKRRPPAEDVWTRWIPEIVVEIVSPGSEDRDYEEKREEYLRFGVREYWIVDAERREVLVLRNVDEEWKERVIRSPTFYRTRLLPGFELNCEQVFHAADEG